MWKYYAILSALFAALTAIFAKIGVRDINSNLATAIRTTIILLLTWGIVIATGTISQIRLFYFKALQTGDVSRVAPIDKLSVVITILLAFILLKEPASPKVIIGALLITAGSLLMLWK